MGWCHIWANMKCFFGKSHETSVPIITAIHRLTWWPKSLFFFTKIRNCTDTVITHSLQAVAGHWTLDTHIWVALVMIQSLQLSDSAHYSLSWISIKTAECLLEVRRRYSTECFLLFFFFNFLWCRLPCLSSRFSRCLWQCFDFLCLTSSSSDDKSLLSPADSESVLLCSESSSSRLTFSSWCRCFDFLCLCDDLIFLLFELCFLCDSQRQWFHTKPSVYMNDWLHQQAGFNKHWDNFVAWLSSDALVLINVVSAHRTRLILGWVTVYGVRAGIPSQHVASRLGQLSLPSI